MMQQVSITKMRELFSRAQSSAEKQVESVGGLTHTFNFTFEGGEQWATFQISMAKVTMKVTRRTESWIEAGPECYAVRN